MLPKFMAHVVSFQKVSFSYVSLSQEIALSSASWELLPNECLGFVGPSGGGKTTLLKLVAGLLTPTEGRVEFKGRSWAERSKRETAHARRQLAMTFQRSGLFDSLSCGDNLRLPLREVLRVAPKEGERRMKEALRAVGLEGTEGRAVSELSGGMQKRLSLARALLFDPELLLLDDPTAGLDPLTASSIDKLILSLRRLRPMSVVLVTSELRQAYHLCDRLAFLHRGKILETASVDDIQKSRHPTVRQFIDGALVGPLTAEIEG